MVKHWRIETLSEKMFDNPGLVTLSGTISDPGTLDSFTLTINWGRSITLGNTEEYFLPANGTDSQTFEITHRYVDDHPTDTASDIYTITATVTDDDTDLDTQTTNVSILNLAPSIVLDQPAAVDENGLATLTGTIIDAGRLDSFTLTINWGDSVTEDNTEEYLLSADESGSQRFEITHQYLDDNPDGTLADIYTITATVTDDDTGHDAESINIVVANAPPTLILDPPVVIGPDGLATLTGTVSDVGTLDTFTLTVDWGDPGSLENTTVELGASELGEQTFTLTHYYLDELSDSYMITVTVTDDDSAEETQTTQVLR